MTKLLSINGIALEPRLEPFDLEIAKGDCIGLLGINGAGKSTLLALIAGGLSPSQGEVIFDATIHSQNAIGWLRQHSTCYPEMSVKENLFFFAEVQQLNASERKAKVTAMLQSFSLGKVKNRLAKNLSGGQLRRLDLACSMIHGPEILLLDEPSAGLDPQQADELRKLINKISRTHAVIIASHILPDIEQCCQKAILLDQGKQVTSVELMNNKTCIQVRFLHKPSDQELLNVAGVEKIIGHDEGLIALQLSDDAPNIMPEKFSCHGWGLQSCQPYSPGIAELFKKISSGEAQ